MDNKRNDRIDGGTEKMETPKNRKSKAGIWKIE